MFNSNYVVLLHQGPTEWRCSSWATESWMPWRRWVFALLWDLGLDEYIAKNASVLAVAKEGQPTAEHKGNECQSMRWCWDDPHRWRNDSAGDYKSLYKCSITEPLVTICSLFFVFTPLLRPLQWWEIVKTGLPCSRGNPQWGFCSTVVVGSTETDSLRLVLKNTVINRKER